MFRMVNMGIFDALSKFESQILSYKQDVEFEILCFVIKARMLLSSVDNINYKHIKSVYLVYHESFCQINGNSILFIICKKKNKRHELCLHNSEFLPLYLSYNLTTNI